MVTLIHLPLDPPPPFNRQNATGDLVEELL